MHFIASLFHTYLSVPVYNLLVYLVGVVPGGDVGLAIIAVTLVIRILLLPIFVSALRTTRGMQALQPKIKEINDKYKNDSNERAKAQMALYKEYDLHPFAPLLILIIQLTIVLALTIVLRHAAFPDIDVSLLYSFVRVPDHVTTLFLGYFPVTGKSVILAVLTGITQFLQAKYAMPAPPKTKEGSVQEDFGRAMTMQARYVLPVVIALVAYGVSGAFALYFITMNVFTLFQEILVRRKPVLPVKAEA